MILPFIFCQKKGTSKFGRSLLYLSAGLSPAFHLYDLANSGKLLFLLYPVIIMPDIGQATTQQNTRQKDDQGNAVHNNFPFFNASLAASVVASDTMVYASL